MLKRTSGLANSWDKEWTWWEEAWRSINLGLAVKTALLAVFWASQTCTRAACETNLRLFHDVFHDAFAREAWRCNDDGFKLIKVEMPSDSRIDLLVEASHCLKNL
jgi:hypothetical protein